MPLSVDEFLASQGTQKQSVDQLLANSQGKKTVDEFLATPIDKPHKITQAFGNINPEVEVMSGGVNSGTDFDYEYGTPVKAPTGSWEVVESYGDDTSHGYVGNSSNKGYGNSVKLKNPQTGEIIRLSHLSTNFAKPGMVVHGGELLGLSGDTGNATGPHLDAEYVDPTGKMGDITQTAYRY